MEGGLLAWKRQSNNSFANSGRYVGMSLPSQPPEGKEWVKRPDGEWSLEDKKPDEKAKGGGEVVESDLVGAEKGNDSNGGTNPKTAAQGEHILHKVNRSLDTLEGLCLRYKTNRRALQQLNGFTGRDLSLAPGVLKIPRAEGVSQTGEEVGAAKMAMER